jgi:hypothetical protein
MSPIALSRRVTVLGASVVLIVLSAVPGWSGGHHHHHGDSAYSPPLHGPGSSHNPIVRHPLHGPGTSHNPILKKKCVARGTVVHDHRNGKNCSYVAGDSRSYSAYLRCEGIHSGGGTPWC